MLGLLLKALAYRAAPRATLAVLHPKAAAQLEAVPFELRHGLAPRLAAAAAAAVALPVGILIGIALEQSRAERETSRRRRPGGRSRGRRTADSVKSRHAAAVREQAFEGPSGGPSGTASAADADDAALAAGLDDVALRMP
jgi:hypothetical protein